MAGKSTQDSLVWKGACYNTTNHEAVPVSVAFEGVEPGTRAELTLLTGPEDPYAYNDPWTGENVVKTTKSVLEANQDGEFQFEMPELSVAVLDTLVEEDSTTEDPAEEEGSEAATKRRKRNRSI